jgi:hypothetical protein
LFVGGGGGSIIDASATSVLVEASGIASPDDSPNGEIIITELSSGAPTYTIDVSASPSAGGVVGGGGTFASASSQTVTATANNGYTFVSWTENGSVVSSIGGYNFTLNTNRNLVANFAQSSASAITNFYTGSETTIGLNPGTYTITAYGAQGGGSDNTMIPGLGAEMSAEFYFTAPTTLTLLVGGGGGHGSGTGWGGGGGGGSFVVKGSTPLVIAGGGGGNTGQNNFSGSGEPGVTTTSGFDGGESINEAGYQVNYYGGTNGSGGEGSINGGGGGGYSGSGTTSTDASGGTDGGQAGPGSSFLSGGAGGVFVVGYYGYGGADGGYGGGGGGISGGGGGGGYSGGGAGLFVGGGGGSIIDASATSVLVEASGIASPDDSPNGEIIITEAPIAISTTAATFGFTNGVFGFDVTGPSGSNVVIQASTDLKTWIPLQTNLLGSGLLYFSDPHSTTNVRRFYRAQLSP